MPRFSRRPVSRNLAMVAALIGLAACQEPIEPAEETSQRLTQKIKAVKTSAAQTRYIFTECPGEDPDCAHPGRIWLLRNEHDTFPFSTSVQGDYEGCGPQAAANYLSYVGGVDMHVKRARDFVNTWFCCGNIASTPNAVREGLEKMLETEGKLGNHDYRMRQGPVLNGNFIEPPELLGALKERLKTGFPLILLVNGGTHWQMITGYSAPDQLYVVDYAYRDADSGEGEDWQRVGDYDPRDSTLLRGYWRSFNDLDFNRFSRSAWFGLGFGAYYPASYVTVTDFRYNPPIGSSPSSPPPPPSSEEPTGGSSSCELGAGCGQNRTYDSTCSCVCSEDARRECESRPEGVAYYWKFGSDCECNEETKS